VEVVEEVVVAVEAKEDREVQEDRWKEEKAREVAKEKEVVREEKEKHPYRESSLLCWDAFV